MTWIRTVRPTDAEGKLKKLYQQVAAPDGSVDQILQAHSLRPHTLSGHMALYKNALHHSGNSVPKWFLELLGVYVSLLNQCAYCVAHHFEGLKRLLKDDDHAYRMLDNLRANQLEPFEKSQQLALIYTRTLTETPSKVSESLVEDLRSAGWQDGEILEINQVVSYFAYANRTVLGLGCSHKDETLGLSPSSSSEGNWAHQ